MLHLFSLLSQVSVQTSFILGYNGFGIELIPRSCYTKFAQFEAEILPTLDTLQAHEDHNDWFFWQGVLTEKQNFLPQLQETKWI